MKARSYKTSVAALALMSMIGAYGFGAVAPALAETAAKPPASHAQTSTAPTKDAVAAATQESNDAAIVKTVDEGYNAMREIRAARLAIFNGQTDMASKFTADAQKDLEAAQAMVATHAIRDKKTPDAGDAYIPIDASLALAEGFMPDTQKQQSIDKANEHLAKGETKNATEVLKLANIDVTVSTVLIPAKASLSHIKDAVTLIGEKKFYEANLALKAIDDSVVVNSYSIDDVPEQG